MFNLFLKYKLQPTVLLIIFTLLAQCNPLDQSTNHSVLKEPEANSAKVYKASLPPVPPPKVEFLAPVDASEIAQPVTILAKVSSDTETTWELRFRVFGAPTYTMLASGDNSISDVVEYIFDPAPLFGGIYEIYLLATDMFGQSSGTSVEVLLTPKLDHAMLIRPRIGRVRGRYLYHFVLPYDSRDKRTWDFDVAWRLSTMNISSFCNLPSCGDTKYEMS